MSERFKAIPCAALILQNEGKVLLSRRVNTGYQDGNYSLVAGHLDGDESPKDAIVREAQEEIGITVVKQNLKLVHTSHQICDDTSERLNMYFETQEWDGEVVNAEPEKCSELAWFSFHELPANIVPYIAYVLKEINRGESYSEYRGSA